MRRHSSGLFFLTAFVWGITFHPAPARAQGAEPAPIESTGGARNDEPDLGADPLGDDPLLDGQPRTQAPAKAEDAQSTRATATDIVVVQRRPFLKSGRLELQPLTGVSVNDTLIRHWAFGGDLNYFLSEVFAVGLQGMYFLKERTEREGLVGLQYNRIATLNKYIWTAALNFTYLPAYGKFTVFNRHLMHWEGFVSGGVGMTQTEIIPRKGGDETFSTNAITANVGVGGRLYVLDWLTLNVALRDFVFNDKFEPTNRGNEPIDQVKNNAEDQFVHNLMLYVGVGFYLPPSFDYRTPR